MNEVELFAMGCQVRVVSERAADLGWLEAWFAEREACLSRFRPDSELSELNRSVGTPRRVSAELFDAVESALAAANETGGLVRPTLLAAVESAGYDKSFERIEREGPGPKLALEPMPSQHVALDRGRRTITLPVGVGLDLGGSAKGRSADRALALLPPGSLVDAGGDVAVSGPRADGEPWPVGIADPRRPGQLLETLAVSAGGVATSGRDVRRWQRDGRWLHHVIDPRHGEPADSDVVSVTVIAPSAFLADVAAKVVLILGSVAGLAWIDERPLLAALALLEDGSLAASQRLEAQLWS